jgi:hypothetical protein
MLFNYLTAARRATIRSEDLDRLVAITRAEFPGDEMMVELHVLRAIQAVERGDVTMEDLQEARSPEAAGGKMGDDGIEPIP